MASSARRRLSNDRSRLHTSPCGRDPCPRRLAIGEGGLHGGRQGAGIPRRDDEPIAPVGHQLGGPADVSRDDWRLERHRFEHRVGRALVRRRLHEQIDGMVEQRHVVDMAKQAAARAEATRLDLRLQRLLPAAVASYQEPSHGMRVPKRRKRLDEQIEPLLRLEPADGADGDLPVRQSESGARLRHSAGSRWNAWWSMPFSSTCTRSGRQPWATRSALTSFETATTTGKRLSTRLSAG